MMTLDEISESLSAIKRAVLHFHTQTALAQTIGVNQSYISKIVAGQMTIDAVVCVQIEKATAGAIKRHELRPDLWDAPKRATSIDPEIRRDESRRRAQAASERRFADMPERMIKVKAAAPFSVGDRVSIDGRPEITVIGTLERKSDGKTRGGKRQSKAEEKGDVGQPAVDGRARKPKSPHKGHLFKG